MRGEAERRVVHRLRLPIGVALTAAALASSVVGVASAGVSNAAAYRGRVNALCRFYTPKFKSVERDMAAANKAGDVHRYAYDVGLLIGISYAQGIRIEQTPVPADARTVMAPVLRQLHSVDLRLLRITTIALKGDLQGVISETKKLGGVSTSLNRSFDAVGLRDCGSRQN
jgi:hypothetical protein